VTRVSGKKEPDHLAWALKYLPLDGSGSTAGQTIPELSDSNHTPSHDHADVDIEAMFNMDDYYRIPHPGPDNTYTAMDIDPQTPPCSDSDCYHQTIRGSPTPSHMSHPASTAALEAFATSNRSATARSPSPVSSEGLDNPRSDTDLEDLVLADPEMRSFLAERLEKKAARIGETRTAGTEHPAAVHRT
jgi:hypothetical protein